MKQTVNVSNKAEVVAAVTSDFDGDYNSLTNTPTVTKVTLKTWTASDMS